MISDPFGRAQRLPPGFDRPARVALLVEVADALMHGRLPDRAAALFTAGGMQAWLARGGDLVGDYWQVKAPRGSHATPSRLVIAMNAKAGDPRQDRPSSPPDPERAPPCNHSTAAPPADT